MDAEWRVFMIRDGKTERTVTVKYLGRRIDVFSPDGKTIDVYDFTDIAPLTRELFAEYSGTIPAGGLR